MTEKENRTILDMRGAVKRCEDISTGLRIEVCALKMFVLRQKQSDVRRCCRRMRGKPGDSDLTNAAMTGGTVIRASFRANISPLLSARFAERVSHRTKRQNTVPERVSTHQDDHNHQRHVAAIFIANSYCSSAGFNVQTQGGYIQTQGYIVKRKEPMVKRKKAPVFDH